MNPPGKPVLIHIHIYTQKTKKVQDDGVLAKILVASQGAEIPCGSGIALMVEDAAAYKAFLAMDPKEYMLADAASAPKAAAAAAVAVPAAEAAPAPVAAAAGSGKMGGRLSPAARHMAESQSLSTALVVGTSKGGRISKSDLVLAIKSGTARAASLTAVPAHPAHAAASAPAHSSSPSAPYVVDTTPVNSSYTDIPNSNMRKVIARRLTESKSTVPHLYLTIDCEIDALLAARKTLKADFDASVSVNDMVIRSAALALRDLPQIGAKWNKATGSVEPAGPVDIAVAVATPNGLITPIVKAADGLGVSEIGAAVRDLAGRAREGKLKPEEYQGGSFSISNLGMFGISEFSAVINPPQACILAVGAGIARMYPPREGATQPRVATVVTVQLSADRRVVDEATAAQYLQCFREYLSKPMQTML